MTVFNRVEYAQVNLDQLKGFAAGSQVTPESLVDAGILRDLRDPVVLLGRGDVDVSLKVQVHRVSRGAREKIESAGGSVDLLPL